jgi:SHS2 domain-containing protein
MKTTAGFQEIAHTADWELTVWAPDLAGLLEQAARGIYALADTTLESAPRQHVEFTLQAEDAESLLVRFVSELLYWAEQENLGFDSFQLHLDSLRLTARLEGAPIAGQEKEIKAVTYHKLAVRSTPGGLEANLVLDV